VTILLLKGKTNGEAGGEMLEKIEAIDFYDNHYFSKFYWRALNMLFSINRFMQELPIKKVNKQGKCKG